MEVINQIFKIKLVRKRLYFFLFYLPDRESFAIVKKIDVGISTFCGNPGHRLRSETKVAYLNDIRDDALTRCSQTIKIDVFGMNENPITMKKVTICPS